MNAISQEVVDTLSLSPEETETLIPGWENGQDIWFLDRGSLRDAYFLADARDGALRCIEDTVREELARELPDWADIDPGDYDPEEILLALGWELEIAQPGALQPLDYTD